MTNFGSVMRLGEDGPEILIGVGSGTYKVDV